MPLRCAPRYTPAQARIDLLRGAEAEREAHRASFDAELARRRAVLGDGAGWAALLGQVAPPR